MKNDDKKKINAHKTEINPRLEICFSLVLINLLLTVLLNSDHLSEHT